MKRSEEWVATMETAEWLCQCTGECGKPHLKGSGRCHRMGAADAADELLAAPGDLFDAPGLVAVCGPCYDRARRKTRQAHEVAALDDQDELFAPGLLAG